MAALLAGCSWQNVANTAVDSSQALRLQDRAQVRLESAWRLPPDTHLQVALTDAPGLWTAAAQRGLDRAASGPKVQQGSHPSFRVWVDWPTPEADTAALASRSLDVGLLGMTRLPRAARTGALRVSIWDGHQNVVLRGSIKIQPQWWGEDWSSEQLLEKAFFNLAQALR